MTDSQEDYYFVNDCMADPLVYRVRKERKIQRMRDPPVSHSVSLFPRFVPCFTRH